jgi:acyl-CoA synthetase (AMP-forming)/AMP-acid ligase II
MNKLKTKLPEYMLPKTIKIVDELPINCNCKIDRKALSDSYEN